MNKIEKKLAIAKLVLVGSKILKHINDNFDLDRLCKERLEVIERGELWVTKESIALAPYIAQLASINSQINAVRATKCSQ